MRFSETRFTLIHVKTLDDTRPSQPVVEVACLRVCNGRVHERFHALVNPECLVPEEFTRLTGLYAETLAECLPVEEILPDLAAFIDRDVIVWTGVRSNAVQRFLRATQPRDKELFLPLLGEKLWPDLARHNLASLVKHCELESGGMTRAEPAVRMAAEVFLRMLNILHDAHGVETMPDLMAFTPKGKAQSRRTRRDLPFDAARLRDYPTGPGVYFMKNRLGEILYVGKAKNLRSRLRSYFQKQSRLPAKVAAMMKQVTAIDVLTVGSELEALLLESRLIKQHQPFFNRKIKDYKRMVFLKVDVADPFPRLTIAEETEDPEAIYFGPFGGKSGLEWRLDLLNRVFKLRSCGDHEFAAHRESPCMQAPLGACSGPCAGLATPEAYREQVADFLRYMLEEPSDTIELLAAKRDAYAEDLQFEKAAALQEQLALLEEMQWRNVGVLRAIARHNGFIVLPHTDPGSRRVLCVHQGVPFRWHTVYTGRDELASVERLVDELLGAMHQAAGRANLPKELFEEARLLSQWLASWEADEERAEACFVPASLNDRSRLCRELTMALFDQDPPMPEALSEKEASR